MGRTEPSRSPVGRGGLMSRTSDAQLLLTNGSQTSEIDVTLWTLWPVITMSYIISKYITFSVIKIVAFECILQMLLHCDPI